MNHLLHLILKKTKVNKLIYKMLNWGGYVRRLPSASSVTPEQARAYLESLHKNPRNSCICTNEAAENPEYDLQIIVPAYNVERYVAECLDSVLAQETGYRYIIKVVNDGSTDGTARILERYRDKKDVRIITQKNRGFSGARNAGLKRIEARYVMFLDSDDKLAPGAVEQLMRTAERTGADIVEGSSKKFCGRFTTKRYVHADLDNAPASALFGFAWGKIYKAGLFANVCFPEGYWFEDTLCALVVHPLAARISTTSHYVYCYRTNFKGISRTFRGNPKCIDSYYVCEQLLEDREALGLKTEGKQADIARQFKLNSARISSLHDERADIAVFVLQSELMNRLFGNAPSDDISARALLEKDYPSFKLQTEWL